MKIWKLLGFAVLVTAAATAMLTSTGVAAGQSKESVTLVWWHNATQGEGLKLWTSVAAEFHKPHPDVTIKAVPLQNEQFTTKIPIALQSNSPPDVFQNWGGGQLVDQVKAGKVADLTKYVKPWIKTIGGSAAGWQVNGKQYAIPYSVGVVGFWYNKELFAQAGITSPPKTWPQFMAAIAKLKAAGIAPIAIGGKDQWPDAFYWDYLAVKLCSKPRDAAVGRDVQLQRPVLAQGRRATRSSCSTPSRSRTASSRPPAQQGATSSAGLLANGKAAMELQGHWNPGVMQRSRRTRRSRASSAGSRSRTSRAARRSPARCSAAVTASPARGRRRSRVRAVPQVHRQPERPAAHRLDELRPAGAEGHGERP